MSITCSGCRRLARHEWPSKAVGGGLGRGRDIRGRRRRDGDGDETAEARRRRREEADHATAFDIITVLASGDALCVGPS